MDFEKLFETARQIMVLRGGPTSGNWAHGGRKGKRGGSGRGGGFKRIGVKSGRATGRKGIKKQSRRTRTKQARTAGGGTPARSGEIPPGVVKRAKGRVAVAKKQRDKDFKAAKKFDVGISHQREIATISLDKSTAERNKGVALKNARLDTEDKANAILRDTKTFDEKKRKQVDALNAKANFLKIQEEKAFARSDDAFGKFTDASDKTEALQSERDRTLPAGKRTIKDVMKDYQKETEAESKVLFQHNLNEGKMAREKIKNAGGKEVATIKDLDAEKLVKKKAANEAFSDLMKTTKESGKDSKEAKEALDKALKSQSEVTEVSDKIREASTRRVAAVQSAIRVDNPTKLTTATGSQKDKANDNVKNRRKKGVEGFQNLVSDDVVPKGTPIKHMNTTDRAFHLGDNISEIHMSSFNQADIVAHELGHAAENYNPGTLARSIAWRNKRTEGEEPQKLKDVDPQKRNFADGEVGKPDKFYDVYIGKDYGPRASEVFSMGIQRMMSDPVGFAEEDPGMFDFIYAQARTP